MPITESNWPAIERLGRVLDHRGAAGDERLVVAAGPLEGLAHGGVAGHALAVVDGIGEGGGEDDARQGVDAGPHGPGEGGGLAAHDTGVEGLGVAEVDDHRARPPIRPDLR